MYKRLQGKVALITGGGTGIGAAVARRFTASGASVAITGRRREPIAGVAAELDCLAIKADTADADDCIAAVAQTVAEFGGLDILIANAGILSSAGSVTTLDEAEWQEVINVNVAGVMQITRAAIPAMTSRGGGAIVSISSVAGIRSSQGFTDYITSKHALIGLTKSLACDYGAQGIRANTLCPGWVKTPMSDGAMASLASRKGLTLDEARALTTQYTPLQRMGEPEEIAACVEFLASDDASFVTGATLVADGGGHIVDIGTLSMTG